MGKKHRERVIRLREAEEASLDEYKAQLREANEITGVPGAEMQREQAKDESEWIKYNPYVDSLGRASAVIPPEDKDKTVYSSTDEQGGPSMKSGFDAGGTSMGSGKLPIGNNVKKSGSQIGKHMNKYGV
jgi:hypothetical protein